MQFEHTIPSLWNHDWILNRSGQVNTYHIAQGLTETVIRYTGAQEQFDAIQASIDSYLVDYLAEVLKPAKWEEVKQLRTQKLAGTVTTPFGVVDADATSRGFINGAASAATIAKITNSPFSVTWTLHNNSTVTLDADQMIGMAVAVMSHVDGCFNQARTFRDEINNAETIAELGAIDITQGWPA